MHCKCQSLIANFCCCCHGELSTDFVCNRYPTGVADDSRTAYMRLVLWAAAAKATAAFYGLDPSDDDFQWQQLLLRSRSQELLGAGT